jgi:hypothetical protein
MASESKVDNISGDIVTSPTSSIRVTVSEDENEEEEVVSNGSGKTNAPEVNYHIIDSRLIRKRVIENKLYPTYEEEINDGLIWRNRWTKISSCFFTITFIVMATSTIISFSAPQFPDVHIMSYLAGCFGVFALMCDRFAHFCNVQSSNNTKIVNMLMKSIGINDTIPDISTVSGGSSIESLNDTVAKIIQKN